MEWHARDDLSWQELYQIVYANSGFWSSTHTFLKINEKKIHKICESKIERGKHFTL